MNTLKGRLIFLAVWWLWMPAATYIIQGALHLLTPGMGTWRQGWRLGTEQREFLPGGSLGHATGLFWLWVLIGLLGTFFILIGGMSAALDEYGDESKAEAILGIIAAITALVVLAVCFVPALWDNDKDLGRYYNEATVFHVAPTGTTPASLSRLMTGAHKTTGTCDYRGAADVPSCIKTDGFAGIRSWAGRSSSYASAQTMMDHAGSPTSNVAAWDDSITYLYGTGEWTAILDGSGRATPIYGIATWDGKTNSVQVGCRFAPGTFDRAFDGARGNSLPNLLGEKYPNLVWNSSDVWGYCQGTKPVIVVPVERQIPFHQRTVMTAGGVLILTGDRGVHITYRATVNAGELPGPAYPLSLVEQQREQVAWAAGRKWKNQANFGFQPTTEAIQGAATSEYLLQGPDKHLYYVTPLTPNASTSQAFIAYAVTPADATASGHLNRLDLYVLPDGDPSIANLNTLTNRATDTVRGVDPTFLNTGGSLEEFTPLGGDMWRVFGVRRGLTEFYIDLSDTGRVQPKTVTVSGTPYAPTQPAPPSTTVPPAASGCGKPPAKMTTAELTTCLRSLADELGARNGGKS